MQAAEAGRREEHAYQDSPDRGRVLFTALSASQNIQKPSLRRTPRRAPRCPKQLLLLYLCRPRRRHRSRSCSAQRGPPCHITSVRDLVLQRLGVEMETSGLPVSGALIFCDAHRGVQFTLCAWQRRHSTNSPHLDVVIEAVRLFYRRFELQKER